LRLVIQINIERDGRRALFDGAHFDVREVIRARHDLSERLGDFDFTVLVHAKVILQIIAQPIHIALHFTALVLGHFHKAAVLGVILVAKGAVDAILGLGFRIVFAIVTVVTEANHARIGRHGLNRVDAIVGIDCFDDALPRRT